MSMVEAFSTPTNVMTRGGGGGTTRSITSGSIAFLNRHPSFTTTPATKPLTLFSDDNNSGDGDKDNLSPSEALLKSRTDIRTFLTQRAIQSFMFLLLSCRDRPTVTWLQVSERQQIYVIVCV